MSTNNISTNNDELTLIARAYYGGSINPLTTLEASQYDASLSYVQQIQRYGLSRSLIAELYGLSRNQDASQIFNPSATHGLTENDWAELNQTVLGAYSEANTYVNSTFHALNLVNKVADPELYPEYAEWFGYAATSGVLTDAQRQMAEDSYLTDGTRVTAQFFRNELDISNEVSDVLVEVRAWGERFDVSEDILSEDLAYYDDDTELCWNESDSRWVESEYGFNAFSTPKAIGNDSYSMTRLANGQEVKIHFSVLRSSDKLYRSALHNWDNLLDFSAAKVDGALVRGRFEFPEEMCFELFGRSSIETAAFSSLSANDIVALTHPSAYQQDLFEINEDLQRITLTESGYQFDYRIIKLGDREVMSVFAVWGADDMGWYPTAWVWHQGEAIRVELIDAEELNTMIASETDIAISDQAATDLLMQLRALPKP